jgi:uncharacterized protein (TIGR03083 family)
MTVAPAADTAYRRVRQNVAAVLAAYPSQPGLAVPHCPEWSITDLVQHLVENCRGVNAWVSGAGGPTLTARRIADLLAEWESLSGPVDAYLSGQGSGGKIFVMDAFTHELDLRDSLGAPPPPADHPALPIAAEVVVQGLSSSLRGRGLPALRIETEHGQWTAGEGRPAATMAGSWHDVYLSLAGRRSGERIRALRWSADPVPFLPAFTWGPFVVPQPAR